MHVLTHGVKFFHRGKMKINLLVFLALVSLPLHLGQFLCNHGYEEWGILIHKTLVLVMNNFLHSCAN